MIARDDDRTWARTDQTMTPPQRTFARHMRKEPTEAERKLWWRLRHRFAMSGTHFRRQVQICPYIADFACHQSKLILEIDGGHHVQQSNDDFARTRRLEAEGYRLLGFWNNDVLSNIDGVLTAIQNAATPAPDPSPQGGREKKKREPSRRG